MNLSLAPAITERTGQLISTLKRWRREKSREQYPLKVGLNTWMEVRGSQQAYGQFKDQIWAEGMKGDLPSSNVGRAANRVNTAQNRYAQASLESFIQDLDLPGTVAGIEMRSFKSRIAAAQRGDNSAVEELEYAYIFYKVALDYFNDWCIQAVAGGDPHDIYSSISGSYQSNMPTDFPEVLQQYFHVATGTLARNGQSALKEAYSPLPSLW